MGITVVTPPATTLLTTLARVKAELGITDISSDDILNELIDEASSAIAKECGWPFGVATYSETLPGSGSQLLGLGRVPIISVSQVLQDSDPLPTATVDAESGYSIEDADAGALYRRVGWGRTSGLLGWGSEAYATGYILPGRGATLRYAVTYTAGYTLPPLLNTILPPDPADPLSPPPLPGAVQRACLTTIRSWWFSLNQDSTVASAQVDNVRIAYRAALLRALPDDALGLLRNYRRAY